MYIYISVYNQRIVYYCHKVQDLLSPSLINDLIVTHLRMLKIIVIYFNVSHFVTWLFSEFIIKPSNLCKLSLILKDIVEGHLLFENVVNIFFATSLSVSLHNPLDFYKKKVCCIVMSRPSVTHEVLYIYIYIYVCTIIPLGKLL